MGKFGDIVKDMGSRIATSPPGFVTGSSSTPIHQQGSAEQPGLAASSNVATTSESGVTNQVADSSLFGNMTNGAGASRFGANFGQQGLAASGLPQQGNQPNGYQILGAPRII